jgi:hypothetical protein
MKASCIITKANSISVHFCKAKSTGEDAKLTSNKALYVEVNLEMERKMGFSEFEHLITNTKETLITACLKGKEFL